MYCSMLITMHTNLSTERGRRLHGRKNQPQTWFRGIAAVSVTVSIISFRIFCHAVADALLSSSWSVGSDVEQAMKGSTVSSPSGKGAVFSSSLLPSSSPEPTLAELEGPGISSWTNCSEVLPVAGLLVTLRTGRDKRRYAILSKFSH